MPAAALLLAACSAAPDAGNATAAAPTPQPSATAAEASSSPATTPAPAPGAIRTFKDWTVACDNLNRCAMASLGPEAGDFPEYSLQLSRTAGPDGGWELAVYSQRDAGPVPAAITVDGRRFPFAGDHLAGAGAAAIAWAVANGERLAVLDGAGKQLAAVSLAGASAALRYIDAKQGRAGGVTALVAKGSSPASAVPPAPAQPSLTIQPIGPAGGSASAAQLAAMRKLGECEDAPEGVDWSPELHPLGDGRTLAILPCSAGAYNVIGALFVLDGERVTPAQVDAPSGFEETGADSGTPVHSVINGSVDAGQLTSYAKGRGLGDCGVAQTFAWDGTRLRLTEQDEMAQCRGNPNYLRTWTVRAVRP